MGILYNYITAPPPFRVENVKIAEHVGNQKSNESSSSNIEDLIPKKIRELFENPEPEKFFQVYYLNAGSQIMLKNQWLFEGRDKDYTDTAHVEVAGTCTQVVVTFQGRTARHPNFAKGEHTDMKVGEPVKISLHGANIP